MPEEEDSTGLASWADLPVEILEQIIVLSDTPTLLSLGKLNHTLNQLALEELFKRENVTNPKQGYVVSRLAPKEVVPALNAALWIKHLPHVTYYLNPDIKRLFEEVKGIAELMKRVPTNERLDLYFSSVDRWFSDKAVLGREEGEVTQISTVVWRTIFITLLETALSKGCRSMRVEGGHRLETYYVDHSPLESAQKATTASTGTTTDSDVTMALPHTDLHSLRLANNQPDTGSTPALTTALPDRNRPSPGRRLIRWFKKRLRFQAPKPRPPALASSAPLSQAPPVPVAQVPPPPSPQVFQPAPLMPEPELVVPDETAATTFAISSPSLTTFNLRSSMMMQPLFFPHTINLIRNHSSTLRHLEIVSIKIAKPIWEKFFTSLTLPVLQEFIYLYDTLIVEEPFVTPQLLLDFFSRHPTLHTVELYGVSTTSTFPPTNSTLLPNLKSLNAHPQIVSWLLHDPTSCPNLSFVSLTSEYLASRLSIADPNISPYDTFDTGIITIGSLCRPLHVQFKFSTERDLLAWFLMHVTAGSTNTSPIQHLTQITKFTISSHYHTRFGMEHREVIPLWLKLFPKLKILEMVELPFPEELKSEMFVTAVKQAVPGLEVWIVGRDRVIGGGIA